MAIMTSRQWLTVFIAFLTGFMVARLLSVPPPPSSRITSLPSSSPSSGCPTSGNVRRSSNNGDDSGDCDASRVLSHDLFPIAPSGLQSKLWYGESDLEALPHMLGPRVEPVSRNRSLVVIIAGTKDASDVDNTIQRFGGGGGADSNSEFTFMIFHWDTDTSVWSQYTWYTSVIRISVTRQMKWWYYKRFLHPAVVEPYEYIWLVDADLKTEHLHPRVIVALLRAFGIQISQPAHCPDTSYAFWPVTRQVLPYRGHTLFNLGMSPLGSGLIPLMDRHDEPVMINPPVMVDSYATKMQYLHQSTDNQQWVDVPTKIKRDRIRRTTSDDSDGSDVDLTNRNHSAAVGRVTNDNSDSNSSDDDIAEEDDPIHHRLTHHHGTDRNGDARIFDGSAMIGRWEEFIECGPITIFSRIAWQCMWPLLRNDVAAGHGYDLHWSRLCGQGRTAILDTVCMTHLHQKSASGNQHYDTEVEREFKSVRDTWKDLKPPALRRHQIVPSRAVQPTANTILMDDLLPSADKALISSAMVSPDTIKWATLPGVTSIIVINLESRPDRWMRMCSRLALFGLRAHRFNAITPDAPAVTALLTSLPAAVTEKVNAAQVATFLSHLGALSLANDMGHDSVIIMEDDTMVKRDFIPAFTTIATNLPDNWRLMMLSAWQTSWAGCDFIGRQWQLKNIYKMTDQSRHATSYLIQKEAYQYILNTWKSSTGEWQQHPKKGSDGAAAADNYPLPIPQSLLQSLRGAIEPSAAVNVGKTIGGGSTSVTMFVGVAHGPLTIPECYDSDIGVIKPHACKSYYDFYKYDQFI